jgi:hypothetical protein
MSVHEKRIVWGYRPCGGDDVLQLFPADVDHLKRIYKTHRIEPESVDRVTVEFLLQREDLSRFIIKELDLLLKVGGIFEVVIVDSKSHSSYTRSRDQVKYEMAVSTDGRYRMTESKALSDGKLQKLSYRKTRATLPEDDSIDRWSFGIITNGKKTSQVEELAASIVRQGIPEYEILVCGPFVSQRDFENLHVLDDVVLADDVRAPISAKKNKIIRAARYNNLCILHDRFRLPDDWHSRFRQYGNFFDFICLPTVDESGRRFMVDWMRFCYPVTKRCVYNRASAYSRWSTEQIIQGGVILGKKSMMSPYLLDERLHWEEMEDMQFSKMAYLHGAFMNVDVNNRVVSKAVNHQPEQPTETFVVLRGWFSWVLNLAIHFLKFQIHTRTYVRD